MKSANYSRFRQPFVLMLTLGLFALTGCKSYQLGHPSELPFETIYVTPAKNDSYAPQAQALVSAAVRNAIVRDGRVMLTGNSKEADAILEIALSDYHRRTGTRDEDDTRIAQDYDLSLEVLISLYDQRNQEFLIDPTMLADTTVAYVRDLYAEDTEPQTQGLTQSENQAIPRLARDLGRKIADEVLSAW